MPGSVPNASPATVMPDGLARMFTASREFWAHENTYRAGERQTGLLVSTSRKAWVVTRRLVAASLVALRDFYDARGVESFYFYDLITTKTAVYDATGTLTAGRHTVVFRGEWSQAAGMARTDCPIRLVEVN